MHPKVKKAFEEIDAALFSGDTFDNPDDRKELLAYLGRWSHKTYGERKVPSTADKMIELIRSNPSGLKDLLSGFVAGARQNGNIAEALCRMAGWWGAITVIVDRNGIEMRSVADPDCDRAAVVHDVIEQFSSAMEDVAATKLTKYGTFSSIVSAKPRDN